MTPEKSTELGIHTIYQENTLVPYLSVAENIFLGQEETKGRVKIINWRGLYAKAERIIDRLKMDVDPHAICADLGIAAQQAVQIAKALANDCKVVVMDEPTASFGKAEISNLFQIIRTLQSEGKSIIYISHHLDEVFEISDRITVLRDGLYINTFIREDVDKVTLINNMVGRDLSTFYYKEEVEIKDSAFRVDGMSLGDTVKNVSFEAYRGEILGVYGMVGSGRTDLARLIFGVDKADSGKVFLDGKEITPKSPQEAIASGLAFITEDRRKSGLVLIQSIENNIVLSALKKFKNLIVKPKDVGNIGTRMMDELNIKAPTGKTLTMNLSGGNQQKVVIAKWLYADAEVYIFDEPTRGIDVGAKGEIYKISIDLVKQGKVLIFITSDMEELLSMSDRILIMRQGQIVAELSKQEATQSRVLYESIGGEKIG
jgi:ribose transport system ATP-binding protein